MIFPTTFPFLTIPTGAGPGQQRITINANQDGEIKVYNSTGFLVDTIGGSDGEINLTSPNGTRIDLDPSGPRSGGAEIDLYPDNSGQFVAIEAKSGLQFGPRMLVDTGSVTNAGHDYSTFFDIEPTGFSTETLIDGASAARFVVAGPQAFMEHDPSGNAVLVNESGTTVTGIVNSYNSNVTTAYTPVVLNGGGVTFSTKTGEYMQFGKWFWVRTFLVVNAAGSGATPITITMPFTLDRNARQFVSCHMDGVTAALGGFGGAVAFTSGSGATMDRVRSYSNANVTGADLLANAVLTFEGWLLMA